MTTAAETRVVVVDDMPDAADALVALLEAYGYRAALAREGAQALQVIEQFKPHCVLLDVHMPGIGGLELTRRLRERYRDDIVLIAVSGAMADSAEAASTFELVDHYLLKPIDMAQFERILPPLAS